MHTGVTTVRIEKDNNTIKYIKIIREYDSSLPLGQLKSAIDNGDVVFSFDSNNNPLIANGKDSTTRFLEYYFIKTLKELKKAGAKMVVYNETWDEYEDFSTVNKPDKEKRIEKTDSSVMDQIIQKWNLPESYLKYLSTHPFSQEIEIEDEETGEMIVISLYGANDLLRSQDGYAYNPVEKAVIEDWDPNLVVIADTEADPFCIDIRQNDPRILHAMHGMDEWDFDEYCASITDFLEMLDIQID